MRRAALFGCVWVCVWGCGGYLRSLDDGGARVIVTAERDLPEGCTLVEVLESGDLSASGARKHLQNQAADAGASHVVLGDYSRPPEAEGLLGVCATCTTMSAQAYRCPGADLPLARPCLAFPRRARPFLGPGSPGGHCRRGHRLRPAPRPLWPPRRPRRGRPPPPRGLGRVSRAVRRPRRPLGVGAGGAGGRVIGRADSTPWVVVFDFGYLPCACSSTRAPPIWRPPESLGPYDYDARCLPLFSQLLPPLPLLLPQPRAPPVGRCSSLFNGLFSAAPVKGA